MKFSIDGTNDKNIELSHKNLKALFELNKERVFVCLIAGILMLFTLITALMDVQFKEELWYRCVVALLMLGIIIAYTWLYKAYAKIFQNELANQGIYETVKMKYMYSDCIAVVVLSLLIVFQIIL